MRTFDVVVAADSKLGIGKGGGLPWKLPGDMAYFKRITSETASADKRNAVIMGRKTWDSIPAKFRPLPNRLNIVISRQSSAALNLPEGVAAASNLEDALKQAVAATDIENVFVIGGGEIFAASMRHPMCKTLYLTDIHSDFECDTFLPNQLSEFVPLNDARIPVERDNGIEYEFKVFTRNTFVSERDAAGLGAS